MGTPVAVKPSVPCDDCPTCRDGHYDECPRKKLMGLWLDGCYTEKVEVPRTSLVPRPEDVPAWQACLLEPLAVALNTIDRVQIQLGDTVLVLGQGPIGLSVTRLAALSGAGKLIVTDVREEVFEIARAWGATHTIDVREQDPIEAVMELTDGRGADVVIETSGIVASGEIVIDVTRKEGKLAMIGFAKDLTPLPIIPMLMKTLTPTPSAATAGAASTNGLLELLHTGRVQLDELVTHRFALDDVAEALDTGLKRRGARSRSFCRPRASSEEIRRGSDGRHAAMVSLSASRAAPCWARSSATFSVSLCSGSVTSPASYAARRTPRRASPGSGGR